MAERFDPIIERSVLTLFSGGYNYRRFVRDRTRDFLYEAKDSGLYLSDVEPDGGELDNRILAMMHGFCAGYVTAIDDKYDESAVDFDVADDMLDVMAFVQTGIDTRSVPEYIVARSYTFLVTATESDEPTNVRGAMVGSYMRGMLAGVEDVESHVLDDMFSEGGIYFGEQEVARERIRSGLSIFRDLGDVSEVPSLESARFLSDAIAEVACVDPDEFFDRVVAVVCDSVEARLERMLVGRSGFDVRDDHRKAGTRAAVMAQAGIDEALKSLVGGSGCTPDAAKQMLSSDVAGKMVLAVTLESQACGLSERADDMLAFYAGNIAAVMMSANGGTPEGQVRMMMALPEAIGMVLGRVCAEDMDFELSESEVDEVVSIFRS